jgi:hypothetical protein
VNDEEVAARAVAADLIQGQGVQWVHWITRGTFRCRVLVWHCGQTVQRSSR